MEKDTYFDSLATTILNIMSKKETKEVTLKNYTNNYKNEMLLTIIKIGYSMKLVDNLYLKENFFNYIILKLKYNKKLKKFKRFNKNEETTLLIDLAECLKNEITEEEAKEILIKREVIK